MAKHRIPSKPSTLTRAAGGGLVVGGMALGAVALSTTAAPAEANAACGSGISAFSPTGTGNPQNFNIGSGNNLILQPSFFGANTFTGGQSSSTGKHHPKQHAQRHILRRPAQPQSVCFTERESLQPYGNG